MDEDQIKSTVADYIEKEFLNEDEASGFSNDTLLVSSRIMDSISTLQLVDFIETTYGIEFSPHEVDEDNLDSVDRITEFIKQKKSES